MSDAVLLSAMARSDVDAFERIYARYANPLWNFALRQFGSVELAEDAVQEVFISLWERRTSLRIQQGLKAYLYAAVRRRALDHLRHAEVVDRYTALSSDEKPIGMGERLSTPLEHVEAEEVRLIYEHLMDQLSEERRTLVRLRWHEKLSYEEIAQVLNISAAAAQKQVSRLAIQLRDALRRLEE